MIGDRDWRGRLAHVRWIGGPPDAGKSTVADLLGEAHGLAVYHFDRHEMDHIARADPGRHPALCRLRETLAERGEAAWLETSWVRTEPEAMARDTVACWTERVGLAIEDLLALPGERPIVAEGPGFFPGAIRPWLADPRAAIVLVPTEEFKRASHERRGKSRGRVEATSDPARYRRNHIARDLLLAEHYRRMAGETGIGAIEIDGSRPAREIAAEVAGHFGLR